MNLPNESGLQPPTDYSGSFNRFVYSLVPSRKKCLDVGCATGNLGKALISHKSCIVDGIEVNEQAGKLALQSGYRQIWNFDLIKGLEQLAGVKERYDVIICADVLEHLVNPDQALMALRSLLEPRGKLIVSLPNVAFFLNRWDLLLGRWEYTQYGIMDKTHLRFYTIKTGAKLVKDAGFKGVQVRPYNQFGLLRYLNPLDKIFPELLAYQFVVEAEA